MEQEIWKPIKGYEDRYEISNKGRVFSIKNNKILAINYAGRYPMVRLYKGKGGSKIPSRLVHRLVAEAFVDNPYNYNVVNHIDGNRRNNNSSNLEWCTTLQNNRHAYDNNLNNFVEKSAIALKIGQYNARVKNNYVLVILINKDDPLDIRYFKDSKEAAISIDSNQNSIVHCIKGYNEYVLAFKSKYKKYKAYGFKNKDLQKFANGEPLPDVLKGIPWESFLIKEACNDYSSEGK